MLVEPFALTTAPILSSLASPESDLDTWGRTTILHHILIAIWSLNLINWVFLGGALNRFGVRPRTSMGLLGIVFSPVIQGSIMHLLGNSLVFFILGWMVLSRPLTGGIDFIIVTLIVAFAEGLGVWFFGRPLNHIGGSGVIFGYFGFLLFINFLEQNLMALILSLAVGIFYWWTLSGMMPTKDRRISWEAHICGFLGGVFAAQFLPLIRGIFL